MDRPQPARVDPRLTERRRRAWSDPEAFATTLLVLYYDAFLAGRDDDPELGWEEGGPWEWSLETIAAEVRDLCGAEPGPVALGRLAAALEILTTDHFYYDPDAFIRICNALAGSVDGGLGWDPADALECAWGVAEAALIDGPAPPEQFDDQVRGYVGQVLDDEGLVETPGLLALALRDGPDPRGQFADDPELFEAVGSLAADRAAEIDGQVKQCLALLADQLARLPLTSGDAEQFARRLGAAVLRRARALPAAEPADAAPDF